MIRYKGVKPIVKQTMCGYPFKIWKEEPLMPRLDDQFLDCSIFLYPSVEDAERGERIGGSGFLASVHGLYAGPYLPGTDSPISHFYAVSNRHVVRGRIDHKPSPVVR